MCHNHNYSNASISPMPPQPSSSSMRRRRRRQRSSRRRTTGSSRAPPPHSSALAFGVLVALSAGGGPSGCRAFQPPMPIYVPPARQNSHPFMSPPGQTSTTSSSSSSSVRLMLAAPAQHSQVGQLAPAAGLAPSARKPSTALSASQKSDNDNDKSNPQETDDDNTGGPLSTLTAPIRAALAALFAALPPPVQSFLSTLSARLTNLFPTLRVALSSFVVGGILGVGIILYPVYQSIESTPEPVLLFETILSDLDRGYVDRVDTTKLFETGVSAMLKSLDPYTEFENGQDAAELTESVSGRYGGVGLVISGAAPAENAVQVPLEKTEGGSGGGGGSKLLPQDAVDDNLRLNSEPQQPNGAEDSSVPVAYDEKSLIDADDGDDDGLDDEAREAKKELRRQQERARRNGIRVVNAFEGYAYDYGMRVGDRLVAVDGVRLDPDTVTVDGVRNLLRGQPGTFVDVSFVREGVAGETTVSIPRTVVQVSDVKLATLLGKAEDGIGYIQLSGFNANAGREVRNAILGLQRLAEDANPTPGPGVSSSSSLRGLVLDLRNNPGGLLNSAVDVASLLVPQGSDIVSAKGRGFPGVLYRSTEQPILSPSTRLTVLINGQTASAAEIVSGAVQDLDVGVIVGADRTFGKGLVQSVDTLPFGSALKYTVAKYYTPSGRCIQSTNYAEGEGPNSDNGGKYRASRVADRDKRTYFTKHGREVQDGGGVAVDYKIEAPKSSALEYTLLRTGAFSDFAGQWSRDNQLTNNLDVVTDSTYQKFKQFVLERQKEGDIQLDAVYSGPIDNLKKALKQSGYKGTSKELDQLRAALLKDIERDFDRYKTEIKEDIGQNILARYLPESMLLEIGVKRDVQVQAAVELMRDSKSFNTLLGRAGDELDATGDGGGVRVSKDGVGTAVASNKAKSRQKEDFIEEGDTHFQIVFLGDKDIPSRTRN